MVSIARAVIIRDDRVLLGRGNEEDFWTLPGGHVEPGEMSGQALLREVTEELGAANTRIGRLLWIVENHFVYRGQTCHEVGFYYRVELPAGALPICSGEFAGCEPCTRFRWFHLSDIARLDIRPRILSARLDALPAAPEHLQVDEIGPNAD